MPFTRSSELTQILINRSLFLHAIGQGMLGFKRSDARSDLLSGGGRKSKKAQAKNPKKAPQPSKSEEEEEWTGFGS